MSNLIITRIPQFLDPWFAEVEQIWDELEASSNDQESRIVTLESAILSDVVTSLSKSGDPQIQGDVTLSSVGTIVLTQTGQDIEISGGGVTDHGALTGLLDDDHTQYLLANGTRALAGTMSFGNFQISNFRLENLGADPVAGNQGRLIYNTVSNIVKYDNGSSFVSIGASDHGTLIGLADDDHLQYLLTTGIRAVTGDFTVNGIYKNETNEPWQAESQENDDAIAVGFIFNTFNVLNTAGSQILSIRNSTTPYLTLRRDTDLFTNADSVLLELYDISGNLNLQLANGTLNSNLSSLASDEFDINHSNDYSFGAGYKLNQLLSDIVNTDPSMAIYSIHDGIGDTTIQAVGGLDGITMQTTDFVGTAGTAGLLIKNTDINAYGRTDIRLTTFIGETGFEGYLGIAADGTFVGGNNGIGSTKWRFESGAEDGVTTIAYEFDTLNDLTLGSPQLHTSWKKQGLEIMSLSPDGDLSVINNVDITNNLSVNGAINIKRTATAVSTNSAGEFIIGVTDTSISRTITLDTDDEIEGRIIIIKDESGGAGTNNITIDTESASLIDGTASVPITADYGVVRLYFNGSNWFSL